MPLLNPSKIIGIGSNYRRHIEEMGRSVPSQPKIFLMPPSALIGHGDAIQIPPGTERVDHEAELGVIVGRMMQRASRDEAMSYIDGYTAVNDVTARDFQRADGVFARAKGFDTFCPVGPRVVKDIDPFNTRIRCFVDGTLRQDGNTSDMVFDIPTILSFVSHVMTLLPGDLIATGTPMGVGPLRPGQVVSVDIEGIGVLENPVVARMDRGDP